MESSKHVMTKEQLDKHLASENSILIHHFKHIPLNSTYLSFVKGTNC